MPRTRSTKDTSSGEVEGNALKTASGIALAPQVDNPPVLFILPKCASPEAQIITLPHPRHSRPSRYLVCPQSGIYEFTKTTAPKSNPRSWLVESEAGTTQSSDSVDSSRSKAQLVTGAELYIATTIDPLFLLLPALVEPKQAKQPENRKRLFLASDDYFDKLPEESSHLSHILQHDKIRALLEARMGVICDVVEAGDETMFRLSEKKLASAMLDKAKRFSKDGLPPSMESKFVKKPLEAPISVKQKAFIVTETQVTDESGTGALTPLTETTDSQSTVATLESTVSASTTLTSVTELAAEVDSITRVLEPSTEVVELQRIRVALDYICSAYTSPAVGAQIRADISGQSSELIDFTPLDDYLSKVAALRAEAFAERPVDFSQRKRGRDEEDDEQLEKKRKLEEEKKMKAKENKSIKDLKKVDTSGMKKLSHFFKKK